MLPVLQVNRATWMQLPEPKHTDVIEEADREWQRSHLEVVAEPVSIDVLRAVNDAAATFGWMVGDLPAHLNDADVVYEARETLKDWVGEVRIEPTADGPTALWRLNDKGLLFTAGPSVAKMVAGARFGNYLPPPPVSRVGSV